MQRIAQFSMYLPDRRDLIVTIQQINDLTGSMHDLVPFRHVLYQKNEDMRSYMPDLVRLRQALYKKTKILHDLCLIWCD